MKIRSIAVLAFMTLAVAACDDKKAAPGGATSSSGAAKGAAPASGDLGEQSFAMMTKMTAVMVDNADDCDKMATALSKFLTENGEQIKKFKAADKTMTPEEKKAHKEKWHDKEKVVEEKMGPAIMKCKDNKGVQEAMKQLGE